MRCELLSISQAVILFLCLGTAASEHVAVMWPPKRFDDLSVLTYMAYVMFLGSHPQVDNGECISLMFYGMFHVSLGMCAVLQCTPAAANLYFSFRDV